MIRIARVVGAASLLALAIACVDALPAQDLRITEATPVAKTSVELLVQEYATNAADANRRYFGKAVEVTGNVARTVAQSTAGLPGHSLVFTLKANPEQTALTAHLLDDRAAAIVAAVTTTPRITLRCFADKPNGTEVVLRSCVTP